MHAIHNLGSSQSFRYVSLFSNSRTKKGKKAFSDKVSFLNQDEWLQEIEEHERKPGTSEKQSDLLT